MTKKILILITCLLFTGFVSAWSEAEVFSLERDVAIEIENYADGTGTRAKIPADAISEGDGFFFEKTWGVLKYVSVSGYFRSGPIYELYSGSGDDEAFITGITEKILSGEYSDLDYLVFTLNGDYAGFEKVPCRAELGFREMSPLEMKTVGKIPAFVSDFAFILYFIYPLYVYLLIRWSFSIFKWTGRNRKASNLMLGLKNFRTMALIIVLMVGGIFGIGYLSGAGGGDGTGEGLSIIAFLSTGLGAVILFKEGLRDVRKRRCPNCRFYGGYVTDVRHTGTSVDRWMNRYFNGSGRHYKTTTSTRTTQLYTYDMTCPECGAHWDFYDSTSSTSEG